MFNIYDSPFAVSTKPLTHNFAWLGILLLDKNKDVKTPGRWYQPKTANKSQSSNRISRQSQIQYTEERDVPNPFFKKMSYFAQTAYTYVYIHIHILKHTTDHFNNQKKFLISR